MAVSVLRRLGYGGRILTRARQVTRVTGHLMASHTKDRLLALRRAGKPIDVYRFPGTEHGMREFVDASGGKRTYTRVTDGFYRLVGDWIRGRNRPPYGRGVSLR